MKKFLFAIFAHPDDESFGPSGTILLESLAGTEIHLVSLTSGDSGMNPDNHDDLGAERLREWQAAGALMGAHSMHHLGYRDGHLTNQTMIEVGQRIIDIVTNTLKSADSECEIEFMTNDLNGISGHIDHIVAARAACFAFYHLQRQGVPMTRIRLSCITHQQLEGVNIDWLYMEPGRSDEQIDEVIDARHLHDEIIAIMRCHRSQRHDGETHIKRRGDQLGMNYFMIKH